MSTLHVTEPTHQGRGAGRRLLRAGLGWVDDLGVAGSLEAQRHEQPILPGGATKWGMLRSARSA